MILQHQFNCGYKGCKVYAYVEIHCHDEHKIDVDKLGEALGFCMKPIRDNMIFVHPPWYCDEHQQEK